MKELSIIIPLYNGSKTIERLIEVIEIELSKVNFEIILVNDGSTDNSFEIGNKIAETKKDVKFINLRKNFGEFNAVMCGLNFINGNYAVLIDDDFQNPPSEILKLYNKAKEGNYDVVYSYYNSKKHHWFRNLGSKIVNTFTTYLLKKPKNLYLSSFKILNKELVDEIVKFKGPNPYIDGLIFQITNNVSSIEVFHAQRQNGDSSYSTRKLISLFLTIIFGYSLVPLRLTFLAGFISITFSLVYMLLYVLDIIPEWGSPIVIFMCGCILCSIALIGEYIGNAFLQLNGKPQYIIKSINQKK
jgi:glycosyltransferase involved in cell wall biosynthesis